MFNSANKLDEINLDGFQIVNSDMFNHPNRCASPTCTIWPGKIAFNTLAIKALNSCEFIRIEVNPNTMSILVVPVTSNDKDSIRWIRSANDPTARNMESKPFGTQLYTTWKLDTDLVYRCAGRLVSAKSKVMLLFDFSTSEKWHAKKAGTAGE